MKEIEKVSISGIAFMLDQDAFQAMNAYLARLQAAYVNDPDGVEIIADIEARIAEIILSKQDAGGIVSLPLVEHIVAQLGTPEEQGQPAPEAPKSPAQAFPRRLYRNPEGAKLGGVCSGIATFFDVDTVWVRLAMFAPLVLLVLTSPMHGAPIRAFHGMLGTLTGVVFLLYFILWFIVPMARTPRQKLEMKGERITASSIESNLRSDFAAANSTPRQAQRSASVWAEIFYTLGRVALFGIKAIALLVTLGLVLTAVGLIVGIGTAFVAGAEVFKFGHSDFADFLWGLTSMTPEAYLAIGMLLLLIPVVLVVWLLFCLIFDRRLSGKFFSIAGGIWLILTIYISIVTIKEVNEYTRSGREQHRQRFRTERHEVDGRVIWEKVTPLDSLQADSIAVDTVTSKK